MLEERRKEIEASILLGAMKAGEAELIPGEKINFFITVYPPKTKDTPPPCFVEIVRPPLEIEPADEPVLVPVAVRS